MWRSEAVEQPPVDIRVMGEVGSRDARRAVVSNYLKGNWAVYFYVFNIESLWISIFRPLESRMPLCKGNAVSQQRMALI